MRLCERRGSSPAAPNALLARCTAAGLLLDARRAMGDVVVITHDASVARWAEGLCAVEATGGTRLWLEPVVVQLTLAEVDALLAPGRAELALFAAWAVHDQSGARARAAVERAAETILAVEDPTLRDELLHAMLTMLGDPLRRIVQEILSMKPLVLPDSTAYNDLVASCNARGLTLDEALEQARLAALWGRAVKSSALLHLLAVRGMLVSDDVRARVYARLELSVLDRWFERAVTAASIAEVFAEDLEAIDGDVSTNALEQSLSILRNTRLGEQLVAEGRTWGQLDTLEPQLALRLGRPTTSAERATLRRRLDVLGPERVGVVVLRFAPEALDAWLAAPDAT